MQLILPNNLVKEGVHLEATRRVIGSLWGLIDPNFSSRYNNNGPMNLVGEFFPVGEMDLIRLLVGLVPYWCGVAFGGVRVPHQISFFSSLGESVSSVVIAR